MLGPISRIEPRLATCVYLASVAPGWTDAEGLTAEGLAAVKAFLRARAAAGDFGELGPVILAYRTDTAVPRWDRAVHLGVPPGELQGRLEAELLAAQSLAETFAGEPPHRRIAGRTPLRPPEAARPPAEGAPGPGRARPARRPAAGPEIERA